MVVFKLLPKVSIIPNCNMKKFLFILGVVFSLPLFSQISIQYPITLPSEVTILKAPSDYVYGTNNHTVVEYTIKVEGKVPLRIIDNSLDGQFVVERLTNMCPDGCLFLITEIRYKQENDGVITQGGIEGPFPYLKFFKP